MNVSGKVLLELDSAKHLMWRITKETLIPVDKPDSTQPSRQGGRPDFIFEDSKKRRYALELTQLLTPELRNLERAVTAQVCAPVEHLLPGTYGLHIHLTDPLGRGRISPEVLRQTAQEIAVILKDGTLQSTQQLSTGFVLWKARDEGNRLVP
jgi:hypothetical protein